MYSLFLYDTSFQHQVYTKSKLDIYLQKIHFIKCNNNTFVPADQFMFLITFLGCSPNIELEIKTKIKTHVNQKLLAYGGNSIEKIICPQCKTKINTPSRLIDNFNQKKIWPSECCKIDIDKKAINWRKSAAFSQAFIQINNIFPKEAIPSDQLLKFLSDFSQSPWSYFYSKQQKF